MCEKGRVIGHERGEDTVEQSKRWGSEALIVLNYSTDSKAEWADEALLYSVRAHACVRVCVPLSTFCYNVDV